MNRSEEAQRPRGRSNPLPEQIFPQAVFLSVRCYHCGQLLACLQRRRVQVDMAGNDRRLVFRHDLCAVPLPKQLVKLTLCHGGNLVWDGVLRMTGMGSDTGRLDGFREENSQIHQWHRQR